MGDFHGDRPARGHRGGLLAGRRVSGDHAADRPGDSQLPRGQRPGRGRHGGRADRAAGRRRGRDAVHVVAEQQRRLVHPGRDLRAGHQREHGPGAGAEPRRHRRADAPRRGSDHRREHQETVPGRLAGDQSVFRGQPGDRPAVLRFALPEQLRHDPGQGRRGPGGGRRRRDRSSASRTTACASGWTRTSCSRGT